MTHYDRSPRPLKKLSSKQALMRKFRYKWHFAALFGSLASILPMEMSALAAMQRANARYAPAGLDVAIAVLGIILTGIVAIRFPKDVLKRLPFSALVILFTLYALLGWLLGIHNLFWFIWVAIIVGSVAVAVVRSLELGMIGLRVLILAGIAEIVSLVATTALKQIAVGQIAKALAMSLALAGAWLWSVGGTRFRMESIGLERSHIAWTIIFVSWEGLWFGWVIDTFLAPHWGEFVNQILTL